MTADQQSLGRARASDLGLLTYKVWHDLPDTHYYKCSDVDALLGAATEVGLYRTDEGLGYDRWKADEYSCGRRTHTGLVIGIRPIAQPTREEQALELLKALVKWSEGAEIVAFRGTPPDIQSLQAVLERTRALLAKDAV